MSTFDKLFLSVPALAGAIPILFNLASTVTVLFLVIGFYLGVVAAVEHDQMKTAFAAMSGLVALGGFVHAAMAALPAPVAQVPEGADRQHLLPQRQQQCRHLRLHDRRGRGAGMQGGVSGLLFPAHREDAADAGRARRTHRGLAQGAHSASTSISRSTTRSASSIGSTCSSATASGSRCRRREEALARLDERVGRFFPVQRGLAATREA